MNKPTRCIDPVVKYCQGCPWGYVHYPEWVETADDLDGCCFESGCTLGYDRGRSEDEPTEAELKKFRDFCDGVYRATESHDEWDDHLHSGLMEE